MQLRSSTTSIGAVDVSEERVQGGKVATDAHYVDKLIRAHELEAEARSELDKFMQRKHDIINQIHALNSSNHVQILYKHYVEFKTLKVISEEMNYDYSYIRALHRQALIKFEKMYENV